MLWFADDGGKEARASKVWVPKLELGNQLVLLRALKKKPINATH